MEFTKSKAIQPVELTSIKEGQIFNLGVHQLSEDEIINFAKEFDPLPFHLSRESAKKSMFGDLVASGPQIFIFVHRDQWIPRFGHSVLAGLEIEKWKFLKPIYANENYSSSVKVSQVTPTEKQGVSVITWYYEFLNERNEQACTLTMKILHKLV